MSKKEDCLKYIEQVITSLEKDMLKIELLVNGSTIEHPISTDKRATFFGEWFYQNEILQKNLGSILYDKLYNLHSSWHIQYKKIYDIYFGDNKSLFKKFFNKKPSSMDIDKALAYFDDLKSINSELLHTLEVSQRRLSALSETKFES